MIRAMGENNKEKKDKGAQIGLGLREVASLKMLFREDLSRKIVFEKRPKESEGMGHGNLGYNRLRKC